MLRKEEAKNISIKKPVSPISNKIIVNPLGNFLPLKSILEKKIIYTKANTPNISKNSGSRFNILSNNIRGEGGIRTLVPARTDLTV